MADTKISALTGATTPLAGTEVVPLVQSSTTKNVSVANLTAGRAVSAASLSLTSPLDSSSGGTGLSSFTQHGVVVAVSASGLSTGTSLTFDGKDLGVGSRSNYGASTSGLTLDNTGNYQSVNWKVNSTAVGSAYTNGTSGFIFGTENSSPLQFQTAGVVRAEVQTDGDFSIGNGNLVIGTSGKGIVDSTAAVTMNFTSTAATVSGGVLAAPAPVLSGQQSLTTSGTINATTYLVTMYSLSGTATLTLPSSQPVGRIIRIRTQSAQAVISASNNITSLASGAVTNAILSATAGKWADLWFDGNYWNIIAAN